MIVIFDIDYRIVFLDPASLDDVPLVDLPGDHRLDDLHPIDRCKSHDVSPPLDGLLPGDEGEEEWGSEENQDRQRGEATDDPWRGHTGGKGGRGAGCVGSHDHDASRVESHRRRTSSRVLATTRVQGDDGPKSESVSAASPSRSNPSRMTYTVSRTATRMR